MLGGEHQVEVRDEALVEPDVSPVLEGDRVAQPLVRGLVGDGLRAEDVAAVNGQCLVLESELERERNHDRAVGVERVGAEQLFEEVDGLDGHRQGVADIRPRIAGNVVTQQRTVGVWPPMLDALELADIDGGQIRGHRVVHPPRGGGAAVDRRLVDQQSGGGGRR